MNILFITMAWPKCNQNNMYRDMANEFLVKGNSVWVATLSEKRNGKSTTLSNEDDVKVLRVKCGNIQKTNKYSKVINSYIGGYKLLFMVCHYFKRVDFDMILFALPPLTITSPVILLKRILGAKLYLLLKEFWPQDPADLGAMCIGGIVWRVFTKWEKHLFKNCNYIGTMSDAGINFVTDRYPQLSGTVEVCPNTLKYIELDFDREVLRNRYGLDSNKCIFLFGGNLGLSQGIPEMISSIKEMETDMEIQFLIVGDGTEYQVVFEAFKDQQNVLVLNRMPQVEFEELVSACDIGLIFLHPEYTVPNVPSRLVSYLIKSLPVIACVDNATDVGEIIEEADCGISLRNGDTSAFREAVVRMKNLDLRERMRGNSKKLYEQKYSTDKVCEIITRHFSER